MAVPTAKYAGTLRFARPTNRCPGSPLSRARAGLMTIQSHRDMLWHVAGANDMIPGFRHNASQDARNRADGSSGLRLLCYVLSYPVQCHALEERRMAEVKITFDAADDYERFMGRWSRAVGASFLSWLDA